MSQDSARFVVTGEFDAGTFLSSVEAAMKLAEAKITSSLGSAATNVNSALGGNLRSMALQAGNAALTGMSNAANDTNKGLAKTSDSLIKINADLFTAARRALLWGTASRVTFGSIQKIQESTKDIVELNKAIVNIEKIRPKGLPSEAIGGNILDTAQKYGVAFQEIAETQRTFFQQGFNVQQVLKLTEAQLLAVTAAGLTTSQSIELLISSMNVFGIEAEQSLTFIDKLQKVQAEYAVSTQDLADAIQRVGPVVAQVGGDIDNLIGVITALKEATRKSGEFIGTALSTIFSRALTGDGANALRAIGVNINKSAIELRPLSDILGDVAKAWGGLNDQQRISLAMSLGARRRYAQVIALFENYDTVIRATEDAQNSFGASLIAQQKEVTSISRQFSIAREMIRETGMEFVRVALGANDVDHAFLKIAQNIQNFVTAIKSGTLSLGFMKITMEGLGKAIRVAGGGTGLLLLAQGAYLLVQRFGMLAQNLIKMRASLLTTKVAADVLNISLARTAAISAAIGWVAAISTAVAFIFSLKNLNKSLNDTSQNTKDISDVFNDFESQSEAVKNQLKEFYNISKKFRELKGDVFLEQIIGKDLKGSNIKSVVGYLQDVYGAGDKLNTLSIEQIGEAFTKVTGKAFDTNVVFKQLTDTIGYLEATLNGTKLQLEELESGYTNVGLALSDLLGTTARFAQGGQTTTNYLEQLFGPDFLNKIKEFKQQLNVESFLDPQTGQYITVRPTIDSEPFKKSLVDLIYNSKSQIGRLLQDSGDVGRDVAQRMANSFLETGILDFKSIEQDFSLLDKVFKGLAGYKLTTSFDINTKVSQEQLTQLQEALKGVVDEFTNVETLQQRLNNLNTNQDFYKFILGDYSSDTFIEEFAKLKKFLGTDIKNEIEKFEGGVIPAITVLKILERRFRDLTEGIPYFPKKLSEAENALLKFNTSTYETSAAMAKIGLESQALGKTLLSLKETALATQIGKGIEAIANATAVQDQIDSYKSLAEEYKRIVDTYSKEELSKKYGLQIEDINKEIGKLYDEIENLASGLSRQDNEIGKAVIKLNLMVDAYNAVVTSVLNIENTFKANTAAIKANYTAQTNLNKELTKFVVSLNSVSAGLAELNSEIYGVSKFEADIRGITTEYQAQSVEIKRQKSLLLERYALDKNALDSKYKALSADLAVTEAVKSQLDIHKTVVKEQVNAASALKQQADEEYKALEIEQKRLDIEYQQKIYLSELNALLSAAKTEYQNINSLAQGYANATADTLLNLGEIVHKSGGLKKLIEPFAEAYTSSVSDRLSQTLTSLFENAASKSLGSRIDELKERINSLKDASKAEITGMVLQDSIKRGGEYAGDYMYNSISSAVQGTQVVAPEITVPTLEGGTTTLDTSKIEKAMGAFGIVPAVAPETIDYKRLEQTLNPSGVDQQGTLTDILKEILKEMESQSKLELDSVQAQLASAEKQDKNNALLQGLGVALGGIVGGGSAQANLGSQIGGAVVSAFAGPVGGLLGGIFGGLIGGLFGGDDDQQKEPPTAQIYEANTDALRQNTEALIKNTQDFSFMARLLNAPSNFALPAAASIGGGMPSIQINFNGPTGDAKSVQKATYDAVSQAYTDNARRIGRRG